MLDRFAVKPLEVLLGGRRTLDDQLISLRDCALLIGKHPLRHADHAHHRAEQKTVAQTRLGYPAPLADGRHLFARQSHELILQMRCDIIRDRNIACPSDQADAILRPEKSIAGFDMISRAAEDARDPEPKLAAPLLNFA